MIPTNSQFINVVMLAITEAAKEAGVLGISSGSVYASLMGFGITYEMYMMLIDTMVKDNLIMVNNHLITAKEGKHV